MEMKSIFFINDKIQEGLNYEIQEETLNNIVFGVKRHFQEIQFYFLIN